MQIKPASTEHISKYVFNLYQTRLNDNSSKLHRSPLIIGISGPQGSGKSTVVKAVAEILRGKNLNVVDFSLDDVYLTHSDQVTLAQSRPTNRLVSHRGLPGTHDIKLCLTVLNNLRDQKPTEIPIYDKSAFQGHGDRSSKTFPVEPLYDVVLFEGWCVGFRQLPTQKVESIWNSSKGPLANHSLENVQFINDQLAAYDEIWDTFDGLVQLEAQDIQFVYDWRLQQEHDLISQKGSGMSDENVKQFVDGYMPAYELYLRTLERNRTLAITLDRDRKVINLLQNKL